MRRGRGSLGDERGFIMYVTLPSPEELRDLSPKQLRFVEEYCVDFNGKQAALRAGYTRNQASNAAHTIKLNSDVQKAITRRMVLLGLKCEITKDQLIAQLRRVAFADLRNVVQWNEHGVALVASADLTDDNAACVSEVSQTKDGVKIKTHDKITAIGQLSKMLGYDAPTKIELGGVDGKAIQTISAEMTPEQAAEAYRMTRDGS